MNNKPQEDLNHIREMMERSSRFISLSGLSGVFAGISALVGGIYIYFLLESEGLHYFESNEIKLNSSLVFQLVVSGILILLCALSSGIYFTVRKSKKYGFPIWTAVTKKLIFNLAVPLGVGGLYSVALLLHHQYVWIAPVTLLFYGLGLINAEKYTLSDIKYLGFSEIVLGLISLFFLGYGLIFWILGFGVLHIVYGILMYQKYN